MSKIFFRYWLAVVLYATLIFIVSSIPGSDLPQELPVSNYILHILEYLPFGFLVARAMKNTKVSLPLRKIILYSFVSILLYSISDEFHQLFVPGRYCSLTDLLSDNLGAIIGIKFAL